MGPVVIELIKINPHGSYGLGRPCVRGLLARPRSRKACLSGQTELGLSRSSAVYIIQDTQVRARTRMPPTKHAPRGLNCTYQDSGPRPLTHQTRTIPLSSVSTSMIASSGLGNDSWASPPPDAVLRARAPLRDARPGVASPQPPQAAGCLWGIRKLIPPMTVTSARSKRAAGWLRKAKALPLRCCKTCNSLLIKL